MNTINLRKWLVRQGVSPLRADVMRASTLQRAHDDPAYLKFLLTRRDYHPSLPTPAERKAASLEDLL